MSVIYNWPRPPASQPVRGTIPNNKKTRRSVPSRRTAVRESTGVPGRVQGSAGESKEDCPEVIVLAMDVGGNPFVCGSKDQPRMGKQMASGGSKGVQG